MPKREHIISFKEGNGTIDPAIPFNLTNPDFFISADIDQLKVIRDMLTNIITNFPDQPVNQPAPIPAFVQASNIISGKNKDVGNKSFREWFSDLEEPYNIKTIKNMLAAPQSSHIDDLVDSAAKAIENGFPWNESPEGHGYWQEFHLKLKMQNE